MRDLWEFVSPNYFMVQKKENEIVFPFNNFFIFFSSNGFWNHENLFSEQNDPFQYDGLLFICPKVSKFLLLSIKHFFSFPFSICEYCRFGMFCNKTCAMAIQGWTNRRKKDIKLYGDNRKIKVFQFFFFFDLFFQNHDFMTFSSFLLVFFWFWHKIYIQIQTATDNQEIWKHWNCNAFLAEFDVTNIVDVEYRYTSSELDLFFYSPSYSWCFWAKISFHRTMSSWTDSFFLSMIRFQEDFHYNLLPSLY